MTLGLQQKNRCFKWDRQLPELNFTGNGINMCYGRHTGYGGYGEWARGGRQILLDQRSMEKDVQSWIRMENGSISGNVHLNATYGQDWRRLERSHSGQDGLAPPSLGIVYLGIFLVSLLMPSLRL